MLKFRLSATLAVVLTLPGTTAFAQNVSERFYQAVRNDDLATLRVLVKDNGAYVKDARGQTPLMLAAAFGTANDPAEAHMNIATICAGAGTGCP